MQQEQKPAAAARTRARLRQAPALGRDEQRDGAVEGAGVVVDRRVDLQKVQVRLIGWLETVVGERAAAAVAAAAAGSQARTLADCPYD